MKFLKRTLFLIAVLTLTLFSTLLPTQRAYAETKPQAPDGYDLVAVQAGDDLAGKKILVYSEYAFLEGFIFRIVLDNSVKYLVIADVADLKLLTYLVAGLISSR